MADGPHAAEFKRWMRGMIPKRHIVFHLIPISTVVLIVGIAFSGIDSGGDLPGILRLLTLLLSVAVWSFLFAVAMLVYVVRNKCWKFLVVAIPLLITRVVYFSEIFCGNAEDNLYLWLPVEYIVFYLAIHTDKGLAKLSFVAITGALYGLCCLTAAVTFELL